MSAPALHQLAWWPLVFLGAALTIIAPCRAAADPPPVGVASPDGRLAVEVYVNADGGPRYVIRRDGVPALRESRLGLVRADADFSRGLQLVQASPVEPVEERYEILTAKRRMNSYRASRRDFHFATTDGRRVDVRFQVSNDGVAFRYTFPDSDPTTHRMAEEVSSFGLPADARAWLQPMSEAKSGWEKTNPSYEEYYEKDIAVGTPSPTGAGWVFPALFRTGDTWVLLSECALGRNYCGGRLRSDSPGGEYVIGFADPRENYRGGPVQPESSLPWTTPWRVIVVGSLRTVAESMLGVDLAEPPAPESAAEAAAIVPGKASWSWPLLGDRNTNFDVQKRFIDYAAEMGWRYTLIDALWDVQIGYEKMKELVDHAETRGVKILLWYNSAGDWNSSPQTPRNLMVDRETRVREFERVKAMGVAGLKIDFFGGDGQSMIGYYHDILEDAAPFGLLLNFHGATVPRGWQRTYPHLMTVEAIRGLEFVTFEQRNADQEPTHAAMLPFTRNVFDPMDFTPVVLDRIRRIERRTTSAFELALAVLFTSGIQHYAEIPEGMAKAPEYVREFLKRVPSVWDDMRLLDGFPGRYVVLARRGEGRWYVTGINGEDAPRTVNLDLSELRLRGTGELLADGDGGSLSFRREVLQLATDGKLEVTLPPRGGFVAEFE